MTLFTATQKRIEKINRRIVNDLIMRGATEKEIEIMKGQLKFLTAIFLEEAKEMNLKQMFELATDTEQSGWNKLEKEQDEELKKFIQISIMWARNVRLHI